MRVATLGRRLYSLMMFFLVSVLGGVLVAGLFVPTAGLAAESARTFALTLNSLPEELKVAPPTEGSKVLLADGKTVLTTFFDQNRKNVTLDQIAPIMRQAQVGIEDDRFYSHGALDLRGTLRALVRSTSGTTQGGSTLTQQYVKLALLYDAAARHDVVAVEAANSRTVSRKILELRYAVALEKQLSKDQILERYLNISFFGDNSYGIESAAKHYFGATAKTLTLPQAAMLAGIVRNPVTTNPVANPAAATERMRNVLDRLADLKVISTADAKQAKAYKFDRAKVVPNPARGCDDSIYPHLCDYVQKVLMLTPSLGDSRAERLNTLNQAGLTITTHIDPRFQDAAQNAVSSLVAPTDPVNATLTMVQPGTGVIFAMAQSKYAFGKDKAKGETNLNYIAANNMNGSGGAEGGSTFKAFTVTAALLAGWNPVDDFIQSDLYMHFKRNTNFGGCADKARIWTDEPDHGWTVKQSGKTGSLNMYMAATFSSNTFFTQLEQQVGVCNVVKAAEALGLKRADGANLITGLKPDGNRVTQPDVDGDKATFTLGNTYVTPLSLVNTYATLGARGKRCDNIILKSITDLKKNTYQVPAANCAQVIPQEVADRVNDILHGPFSGDGTAHSAMISGYLISGKTGTQTDAPRVLTNGYTPDIAASAIISSDKFHPMFAGKKMSGLPQLAGLTVHGTQYRRGYTLSGSSGSEAGGRLWKPAMLKVLPLLPHTEFVRPENSPYAHVDTNSGIGSMWAYFGKTDPSAVPTPAPQPQPPKPQKPGAVTTITPTPTP